MALNVYRYAYCNEERIDWTCEDDRASAMLDRVHNEEYTKKGTKISVPLLASWGQKSLFAEALKSRSSRSPLEVWKRFAADVRGSGLECGHFTSEEDPDGLVREVQIFYRYEIGLN